MSVLFLQGQTPPQVAQVSPIVLDSDAIHGAWRSPSPFFTQWLAFPGLGSAATIPEVLDEVREAIPIRYEGELELIDECMAHHAGVVGEMGHVMSPTPQLMAAQARFLENEDVAKIIDERPHWHIKALLAAAAIEHGMPILGRSGFWRRLAKTRPIPRGVVDPRTGQWLVPPT